MERFNWFLFKGFVFAFGFLQLCLADKDWAVGCFKLNESSPHFQVSAGNYLVKANQTAATCVRACSALKEGYEQAAVTAKGLCLCSSVSISSSSPNVTNTSCTYCNLPNGKGFHVMVYPVVALPNITLPEAIFVFQTFSVQIAPFAGPQACSYVLDMDDGRIVTITNVNQTVSHVYKAAGVFTIKLTAEPYCLSETVLVEATVKLQSTSPLLKNSTLTCPPAIEPTEKDAYCQLQVLYGVNAVVYNSSFVATLPDTPVEAIGISPSLFYDAERTTHEKNGTYFIPQLTKHYGFVGALEFYADRAGDITIQVFSTLCQNKIFCFGYCIEQAAVCRGSVYPPENLTVLPELLAIVDNVTISASKGYNFHELSSPLFIQENSILAFSSSPDTAALQFTKNGTSIAFFVENQTFSPSTTVAFPISETLGLTPLLRVYYYVMTTLLMSLVPRETGEIVVELNITSTSSESFKTSAKVLVQDKISGLHLISPNVHRYYPINTAIEFQFGVVNGSSVVYFCEFGDGLNFSANISNSTFQRIYQQAGNYTFNVTASNMINCMNLTGTLLVDDIQIYSLEFVRDPRTNPGLILAPYLVEFRVNTTYDDISYTVTSGTNISVFVSCDDNADGVISINISYTEPGQYNITVVARSNNADVEKSISSKVEIQEKIGNITIDRIKYGGQLLGDEIEDQGISDELQLRARVTSGSHVNYSYIMTHENGTVLVFYPHGGEETLSFTLPGRWIITVFARNHFSQSNRTIRVMVHRNCESKVSLYDKRDVKHPLRAKRGSKLVFNSGITVYGKCDNITESSWSYNWTLFKKEGDNYTQQPNTVANEHSFKTQMLEPGFYKLEMLAYAANPAYAAKHVREETYVMINASGPAALIDGGAYREMVYQKGGLLALNASSSYDQDGNYFNSAGLKFNWSCNKSGLGSGHEAVFRVNMSKFALDENVTFSVTVMNNLSLVASANQTIRFIAQGNPTTEIICKVNCLPFVIMTERLSLEGRCTNCTSEGKCTSCSLDPNVRFSWSLSKKNAFEQFKAVNISEADTTTGLGKSNIVIKPNYLEHNTAYQLALRACDISGRKSRSVYAFKTALPPSDGKCVIRPERGTAAITDFRVKCSEWQASYYPLEYSIRYQSSLTPTVNVSSVSGDDKVSILWYHGNEQTSPKSTLPSGLEEKENNLSVTVEIKERYGSYATVNLNVKVKHQNITKEIIERAVKDIKKIDAKEYPQRFNQLVAGMSDILNGPESENENTTQLRLSIMQGLSKIQADTLPLIKQTTHSYQICTYDEKMVSYEAQVLASKKLMSMGELFLDIASSPGERSGQVIDETARSLMSAIANVLEASLFTGKNITKLSAITETEKNLYGTRSKHGKELIKLANETGSVVQKVDEVIHDTSVALLQKKLVGEEKTTITTKNLGMTLHNTHAGDVSIKDFVLSSDAVENVFDHTNDSVFTQAIYFKRNPYTTDIGNSYYIQPEVRSLSFLDTKGNTIPVQNLAKDIEIGLPNNSTMVNFVPMIVSKHDPGIQIYNIFFKERMKTIVLDFQSSAPPTDSGKMRLLIRFGSLVSRSSYDFSHDLDDSCTNCQGLSVDIVNDTTVFIRDTKRVKSTGGRLSIGLHSCFNDSKSCVTSVNYTVFARSVACRFWSQDRWLENGCKVDLRTTPSRTYCSCDHLTAFGSYIVKPTPLTKLSAEDFKQGYVSFIAVLVIFLMYLLALIWARRADRNSVAKLGVGGLADNNSGDRYRYEVAIWTGMRRNAGTESEVTLILSGDRQDSEPRRLINPQAKGFQRGSLEKFIFTTPEDIGDLYCIRIWHDNSKGSWYLSRVMVTDLENTKRYYFICDRWLAVDEDDGAVERLIPTASEDELMEFQHLFISRTKQNLSDTHLWFSVLNRPPQSPFTRVQRLSCCLCILMMTMATNSMFYLAKSEPKPSSTNFIGSYSFTWDEVFIGIQSTLIIFPANLIILFIFRRIRPKPLKTPPKIMLNRPTSIALSEHSSGNSSPLPDAISLQTLHTSCETPPNDTREDDVTMLVNQMKQNKHGKQLTLWNRLMNCLPSLPTSLSRRFLYLAWPLLVVLTLGSATVVILYGMEFGNGRSLQWLFSIIVSIIDDIFVLQPLKVLFLALFFALLVRKPDEGEFKILAGGDRLHDDEEFEVVSQEPSTKREKYESRLPVLPPDEGLLKKARRKRLQERKMMRLMNEIIVHLMFTIIIALVTYGHKDSSANIFHQHMENLQHNASKILTIPELWNWSRNTLIPTMCPEYLYNDADVPTYGFLDDQYNFLISRSRLRLLRMKEERCVTSKKFEQYTHLCTDDYSMFDQDERCYGEKWALATPKNSHNTPWCFKDWRALDGYPMWGIFTTYSGSGYITEIIPGSPNVDRINTMERLAWLDKQTRAVLVEFTVYNANVNMFTAVIWLFELPSYGGVFLSNLVQPMRLNVYVGGFAFFIFACEIVFLLFIVAYSYVAVKKMYHQRQAYFTEFWNLIDFCILTVSLAAIGVYLYRIGLVEELMKKVASLDGSFVNFQYVTFANVAFDCATALVITVTTVKLTKLMRFNLRISLFGKTLQRARPALVWFSLQFGIVVFAFVMLGSLAFGRNVYGYKNIPSTILSLSRVILGKNEFLKLPSIDPVMGPLFFITYILVVVWILMTMFLAILIDAYHEVQWECSELKNEYEMLDFIVKQVKAWTGLGKKKVIQVGPNRRWRNARVRIKAVGAIGRRPRYIPGEEQAILEKTSEVMDKLEYSVRCLEKKVASL